MFAVVILLALFAGSALGAPQTQTAVPLLDGRIVGGNNADITQYPWTISLQYRGSHYCGGALISFTWALSAAHCVVGYPLSVFSIRAGSTAHTAGGQVIPVSAMFPHPLYDTVTADYDITALLLSTPVTAVNAAPVPIAPAGSGPVAGSPATITGWGRLVEGGDIPIALQVVVVPVVSQTSCRLTYGNIVTERMFCAGEPAGGKDACQGDSGGPLVVGGALTGLVSWGAGCARPNYPGVYASLPNLRSWVTDITGI